MPYPQTDVELYPALLTCPGCGEELEPGFAFSPHCGTAQPGSNVAIPYGTNGNGAATLRERKRIGGTRWSQPVEPGAEEPPLLPADALATTATTSTKRRKRRRHKRPLYRRRIVVIPATLILVGVLALGTLAYRAESTLSTLQTVSSPPQVVADNTVGDDPVPAGVAIDSGPAKDAVAANIAADRASGQTTLPDSSSGNGTFGVFKDAASGAGDLAQGAAMAAGVKEPSKDTITILVMGVDARPGAPIDVSVRPDALMVLRLDPVSGSCRALAIPRDTLTELPGYGETKINHALMVGGIPYQMLVVEQLLGIDLDHYALIDFTGFEGLVDAVGGIPVTVPQDITVASGTMEIKSGAQTFDGEQALAYARYRGGADVDVGRVRRQQQIIRGLLTVAGSRNTVKDVNELLPALEDHIRTDLSASELIELADHYRSSCTESALELDSLQGNFQTSSTPDPIFKTILTYNMVEPETVKEKVAELTRP